MHNYCPHRELTNRKCYKRKKLIDLTLYIECNIYMCVCVCKSELKSWFAPITEELADVESTNKNSKTELC